MPCKSTWLPAPKCASIDASTASRTISAKAFRVLSPSSTVCGEGGRSGIGSAPPVGAQAQPASTTDRWPWSRRYRRPHIPETSTASAHLASELPPTQAYSPPGRPGVFPDASSLQQIARPGFDALRCSLNLYPRQIGRLSVTAQSEGHLGAALVAQGAGTSTPPP